MCFHIIKKRKEKGTCKALLNILSLSAKHEGAVHEGIRNVTFLFHVAPCNHPLAHLDPPSRCCATLIDTISDQ